MGRTWICRRCLTVTPESGLVPHKRIKGYSRTTTDKIKACPSCKTGVFYSQLPRRIKAHSA